MNDFIIFLKSGQKGGDGSEMDPFGSIFDAKNRVRALLADKNTSSVTVRIAGGEYFIGSALRFDADDSGKAGRPVVWESDGSGRVLLHASESVSPDRIKPTESGDPLYHRLPFPERTLVTDLSPFGPDLPGGYGSAYAGNDPLSQNSDVELFVNENALSPARYPNNGYVKVEGEPEKSSMTFGYSDPRPERWESTEGVRLHGYFYFDWADASVALGKLDTENKTLTLGEKIHYGIRQGHRYYFYNIPEELDIPGEWYLDPKTGRAYFIAPDNASDIRVVTAKHRLLEINEASNITFRGLSFGYTRATALGITGGENLMFEDCMIFNTGFRAVEIGHSKNNPFGVIGRGGKNHVFKRCRICNTGFGGFDIRAGDRNTLEPTNIRIENCDIYNCSRTGKTYCFGIRLNAVGASVSRCKLHNAPHSVLFFSGNDNTIEYNEIYDVLRESDDASAFYTGRDYTSQGHVIRYNYFHDMASDADTGIGIFGVYADDNSANITFYGNIFLNVQSACLLHGGHDIVFENNLIVGKRAKSQYSIRFHAYGYPESLKEGGQHLIYLAQTPWQNDIWKKRYPRITEYLSWDPDTVQRYPHGCRIENNALICHMPFDINFEYGKPEFGNIIGHNSEISIDTPILNFEQIPALMKMAAQANPSFRELPLDKIVH